MDDSYEVSRRRLLAAACTGAAAFSFTVAAQARAKAKRTKEQVKYQDSPKDIRMCATCTFFVAPKSCKIVEGDVSRTGWCEAFAQVD